MGKAYIAILVSIRQSSGTYKMSKVQKKQTNKNQPKGAKTAKVPEVEDFFTNFLSKKVRNINKKITHIQELEKKQKQTNEELKKDQLEMISRKSELDGLIEENNNIKKIYLEAYSKKAEYEPVKKEEETPKETNTEAKEEPKVEAKVEAAPAPEPVPQIDVAAIQQEAERKGLEKACGA